MRSYSGLIAGTVMVVVCPIRAAPPVRDGTPVPLSRRAPSVVGTGFGHGARLSSPQITPRRPCARLPPVCCGGRVPLHPRGKRLDGVHSRRGRVGYLSTGRALTDNSEFTDCTISKVTVSGFAEGFLRTIVRSSPDSPLLCDGRRHFRIAVVAQFEVDWPYASVPVGPAAPWRRPQRSRTTSRAVP